MKLVQQLYLFRFLLCGFVILLAQNSIAQRISSRFKKGLGISSSTDSLSLVYPFKDYRITPSWQPLSNGLFMSQPNRYSRVLLYDYQNKRYQISERVGNLSPIRIPFNANLKAYQRINQKELNRNYWKTLVNHQLPDTGDADRNWSASVKVNNKAFETIFGGSVIDIKPVGSGDLTFAGKINRNDNPLLNETLRTQTIFDFEPKFQVSLIGKVGNKLHITFNYNSQAQFNFENQFKISYDVLGTTIDQSTIKSINQENAKTLAIGATTKAVENKLYVEDGIIKK